MENNNDLTMEKEISLFDERQQKEREALRSSLLNIKPLENTEDEPTNLKILINEFAWKYAGENTTLGEAEQIACDFWTAMMGTLTK